MMEMVSMCVELSRYLTQCVSKIQNSVVWNSEKKTKIVTQFNMTVFFKDDSVRKLYYYKN